MSDAASDRVRGLILGLASADPGHGATVMALALAEATLDRGRYHADEALNRYLIGFRGEGVEVEELTGAVLQSMLAGLPPDEAARDVRRRREGAASGCAPAHRVAALAAVAALDDAALFDAALADAALTHHDPLAGEVGAGLALTCRALIEGVAWEQALARVRRLVCPEVAQALTPQPNITLDTSGHAASVLRSAVWFVGEARWADDAIAAALDFSGGLDHAPVMVGALAGARWGASGLGPDLPRHMGPLAERVQSVAERLTIGWE